MPLITQADLEKHLQITFGNPADPVVAAYLLQAQAAADAYCGQLLEEQSGVVATFEVDQWDPWYRLPAFPVTAVTSVVVDGETLVDGEGYRWYPDGRIRRISTTDDRSWSTLVAGNVVTFTHGYTAAPEDLKLGLLFIAADLFRSGAEFAKTGGAGAVKSVALDGSDTIEYVAAASMAAQLREGALIGKAAKQLLAPYRRRAM